MLAQRKPTRHAFLALLLALPLSAVAQPNPGDGILGTWLTDEGRFRVVISHCGDEPSDRAEQSRSQDREGRDREDREETEGSLSDSDPEPPEYCGTIIWARPFTEEEQEEFAEDGQPFDPQAAIGSRVLYGFVHEGEDEWKGGKFYLEARDKSYSATLRRVGEDELDVAIRVALVFRKTVRWNRLAGLAETPPPE